MKFRLSALLVILTLSLATWAQDAPTAPNSTPAPQSKSCCHHNMDGMKDGESCCHHAADANTKDAASCCSKNKCDMKDGKSCCVGKDAKTAMKECKKNGCCNDKDKEGKCCGDGKSCGQAKGDKTAMGCCGNKCERHPQTPAGI